MRIAGMTWFSARLLSALLTAALGAALFSEVRRQTGKQSAALLAVLVFVGSTPIFAWFLTVKTYALSTLLLFLAYRAVVRSAAPSTHAWLAAGLCLGLSADTRLYFAGLLPVFLWWLWQTPASARRAAALLALCGGFALAILPNLFLLARDPGTWFFDNLGFHAIRSEYGLIGDFSGKLFMLKTLVLGRGDGNGFQMTLICLFVLLLALRFGIVPPAARLALALALVLSLFCLLPTPPLIQYYCVVVPFFLFFIVSSLNRWLDTLPIAPRRILLGACSILLVAFLASAVPDYQRFLNTGNEVIGVFNVRWAPNWRISSITAVSRAIDRLTRPGERVLSLWPGFLFESHARPVPGLENNAGTYLADRLTRAQQDRYHILAPGDILAGIAARTPRLVILGNQQYAGVRSEPYQQELHAAAYTVLQQIGDITIWRAP